MITAKIRNNIHIPNFDFGNQLSEIAQKIMIPKMAEGIHKNRGIDNKSFPRLDPKTIRQKHSSRPLIATGKLLKAFTFKKRGKSKVVITLNANRKKIGSYLQIEGIRSLSGRKHFNFFGISKKAEDKAVKLMAKFIDKAIKNAKRR